MEGMRFTKYDKYGAYHWKQYEQGTKYTKHTDKIVDWVWELDVLDVGAGDGLITHKLGAIGIDNEETAVRLAREKGAAVFLGDAYATPIPDDAFDAVTMFDVLEHFDEPEIALREARRLAPTLYISTPERGMVNDPFHVREWTREELPEFMLENGWELDGKVEVVPENKCMYARFTRV